MRPQTLQRSVRPALLGLLVPIVLSTAPAAASGAEATLALTSENPCFLDPITERCSVGFEWQRTAPSGKLTVRVRNHNVTTTIVACQDQNAPGSTTFNHVRPTPKTIEVFVTDATRCNDHEYLDGIEPDVAIAVMGVEEPLIALQQQCILRGSATQCSAPVQWLAEPDATYPAVQVRTTPAAFPSPPGTVWRCNQPTSDTVYQDDYALAPFNGHRLTLVRAACCQPTLLDPDCNDDLGPELGSVAVRGIPELNGVWFFPSLLTDSDLSLPQDPDEEFTAEGELRPGRWMTRVVSSDPTEQERRDVMLIAELRRVAADGFNMVQFPLQSMVVPWPDTTQGETVTDILPDIEDRLDNIVRIVQLAAAEGMMVGFNLQHHCLYSNAMATEEGCSHIGGQTINGTFFPVCGSDNIATAKEWHEEIAGYLESELTAAELRHIVSLAPAAHSEAPGGGDPSKPYTVADPCHEEAKKYLREVFPAFQELTDIPVVGATKPDRFKTPTSAQYEPIRGLLGALPTYVVDFLDVTSYYEDRRFHGGTPVTIEPDRIVDVIGEEYSSKVILSDWNIRNMLTPTEMMLPIEDQIDLVRDRAPCNIEFHLDQMPESAFGLAGWWFLQHRSPLTPTTAAGARSVGVRKSNCTAGTGFAATCTYNANDPNEILLLEAFENPFCNNP
jgi:hypothetical protein